MLLGRAIVGMAGWLACTAGAGAGQPLAGPAFVAVALAVHARRLGNPLEQLRPVLVLGVVGTLLETAWIAVGAYVAHEGGRGTPFCPLWVTALWINAAVFAQGALASRLRPGAVAALVGAAATPLGYWGADRLSAISAGWPAGRAIAVAAAYGAIVCPAALWLLQEHAPRTNLSA